MAAASGCLELVHWLVEINTGPRGVAVALEIAKTYKRRAIAEYLSKVA